MRKFDHTVCELIKRRNALQHVARSRQKQLESLQRQLAHMEEETTAIKTTSVGESAAARQLRNLENDLDRAIIKCSETTHIRKIYEGILERLQQVRTMVCRNINCLNFIGYRKG